MSVTGTCAPRSRWSRARALAAKASLIAGITAGAWMGTAVLASATPAIEPTSAAEAAPGNGAEALEVPTTPSPTADLVVEPVEPAPAAVDLQTSSLDPASADAPGDPVQLVEPAVPNVPTALPNIARPAIPAAPGAPAVQVDPAQPHAPAKPQVGDPAPVSIPRPGTPEPTSPVLVDAVAELREAPPEPSAAPAPRGADDRGATSAETGHDSTGSGRTTTAPAQRAEHAPPPPAPVGGPPPDEPAPVQLPATPTLSAAGSAPAAGNGHQQLAVLPAAESEPDSTTSVTGRPESSSLRGSTWSEPSTSPD